MSKQVLFINGSLRKESFNQTIIDYVQENWLKKDIKQNKLVLKMCHFSVKILNSQLLLL